jgi:glycosyltransferase involved in cell wall biosynthesis
MNTAPHSHSNSFDHDFEERASNLLKDVLNAGVVDDSIVILDDKIRERGQQHKENQSVTSGDIHVSPKTIRVSDARSAAPLLDVESDRDTVRLLIVTRNVSIRELGSLSQKHLIELGQVFNEIHVIILNERDEEETVSTVRLSDNVWIYTTESKNWWTTIYDAYKIAGTQISFAGGFRADVVIAEDPFESGIAAYSIARAHKRPFQIHVLEDIYDPSFEARDEYNALRMLSVPFILKRAQCIRTQGEFIRTALIDEYPSIASRTEVLPTYYNLQAWKDTKPQFDLHERYPQFKFIILNISTMSIRSHIQNVITSVAPLLYQYPTIGLVLVGNGPMRSAIEKQVLGLGIQNQVEFEPMPTEVISHMKSANLLIHASEDSEEDVYVLQAATVKLPMVASLSSVANALFIDGESAYLCDSNDTRTITKKINAYLNDNQVRTKFALSAQETVFERIAQDYATYVHAYRNSIERCIGE